MLTGTTSYQAARAINSLGIDLLRLSGAPGANTLLSPYSIHSALAMLYAGADGVTRREMAELLRVPDDDTDIHHPLAELRTALDIAAKAGRANGSLEANGTGPGDSLSLHIANRLFGQAGCDLLRPFLELMEGSYAAPFDQLNFIDDPDGAARHINLWIERETQNRISKLIQPGMFNNLTRLVLANAIYLKAPWAEPFPANQTRPRSFHLSAGRQIKVSTMTLQCSLGWKKVEDFTVVMIPYAGHELQFLILLPDETDGLGQVERQLSVDRLRVWNRLDQREVLIHLPRLTIDPPALQLRPMLEALGLSSVFDIPRGSANFDRLAPRRPGNYLHVSEGIHKAVLELDEKGTVASAASIFGMMLGVQPDEPIEVRVDRPFLFAVQHRPSGACLFLGRVTNPG